MLVHYLIDHYIFPYFIIGVIVTGIIDLAIYYTKAGSRFTFTEIWGSIILWPIILYVFVKGLFNQDQ